jgi:trehalose 6-phosphate phosphatase
MTRTLPASTRGSNAWAELLDSLRRLDRRLLLGLDVDGTLAPIARLPELARVPRRTLGLLEKASRARGVSLVVVSARPLAALRRMIPLPRLRRVGQSGLEGWLAPPATLRSAWRASCRDLARRIEPVAASAPGAFVERKGLTIAVHDRAVSAKRLPALRRSLRRVAPSARALGFRVIGGNRVTEFIPHGYGKGRALRGAITRLRPHVAIYCGDSDGDEEAFAALRAGDISIRVGPGPTRATYRVADVAGVARLLDAVARIRNR